MCLEPSLGAVAMSGRKSKNAPLPVDVAVQAVVVVVFSSAAKVFPNKAAVKSRTRFWETMVDMVVCFFDDGRESVPDDWEKGVRLLRWCAQALIRTAWWVKRVECIISSIRYWMEPKYHSGCSSRCLFGVCQAKVVVLVQTSGTLFFGGTG